MSQQIQITGGAKVRDLQDVIIGASGVLSSLGFDVANGVPKLDSNGKILVSQLPNSVMEYKGTWNAATNTPTLANGTGNQGDVYLCNVAGTVNFGAGPISFIVGDSAVYSGSIWQRSGGATGSVTSVGLSTNGGAITIGSSPITTSGTISFNFNGTNLQYINGAGNLTTFPTLITSIGLTMPSAFSVANSPLTANGTIAVTGAGVASQYIRGDGTLADFPSGGGGGSSVSYYLNGGTSQGTIGGVTYYQMSKTAVTSTGVDFTKSGDGLIVSFLTDDNDPAQLNIPAGNWNLEIYASMSSNGGTPQLYAELYKYNGTTFTLISTSSNEILYDGVNLNLYTFAMSVPATSLTLTDRLAIKLYATNSGGKTTTIHTQDSHLCQIITTFSTGITALNGLTAQVQYFQTGTSGSDFNISSTTATHTFNIPDASASARGLITTGTQTIAGAKTFSGATVFSSTTTHSGVASFGTGSPTAIGTDGTLIIPKIRLYNGTPASIYSDFVSAATSNRSIVVPDASGTLALTSDLASYVPYTGATANVNLANYSLTSSRINIPKNGVSAGILNFTPSSQGAFSTETSIIALGDAALGFGFNPTAGTKSFLLTANNITVGALRTFDLPDASGTLALTSNLSDYVTLATTQTITGSKTFSASPSINVVGQASLSILSSTGNSALILGYVNNVLKGTIDISATEFKLISAIDNILKFQSNANFRASLIFSNSADYSYTFPNATGTLALTSAIPANPVGGTGTANYLSKFTAASTIANSNIYDNGTNVVFGGTGVTTANPTVVMQNRLGTVLSVAGFNWAGTTTDNNSVNSLMIIGGYLNTSAQTVATATSASGMQFYNGGFYWYGNTGLTIGSVYTNTQRMFLTVGGNLIIGSGADAGYKLDVDGTGRFSGALGGTSATFSSSVTAGSILLNGSAVSILADGIKVNRDPSTTSSAIFNANGGAANIISNSGATSTFSPITFRSSDGTTTNELVRITGTGNVGIGTTTPTTKLQVMGSGNVVTIYSDNNTLSLGLGYQGTIHGYLGGFSSRIEAYSNNGGYVYLSSSSTWIPASDVNRKRNFETYSLGLNAILGLKAKRYNMDFQEDGDEKQVGLIAQEVKEHIPQAFEQSEDFIGINYNVIIVTLVNAIQEQQAQIEELKQLINSI
jgi:hypothetical protein